MNEPNDGLKERIERSLVEVRADRSAQIQSSPEKIKERLNAVNCHSEHSHKDHAQREPSKPAPIQFQQESERQNDWRTFEMHSQRQRQRGKERSFRIKEQAEENEIERVNVDLDIE